jgi:hypothetical protein
MKDNRSDPRDWHERKIEELRNPTPAKAKPKARKRGPGKPESPESKETFPHRTEKPGGAGLANEARPGLGTRADNPDPAAAPAPDQNVSKSDPPQATPYAYEEPRPEPRDQPPDSRPHQEERSTGVSGHTGLT